MPLGGGLGGHQYVNSAGLHGLDQGPGVRGAAYSVRGEDRDPRLGKQQAGLLLQPLDPRTDRHEGVRRPAVGAVGGAGHGEAGQVADKAVGVAMLDQPGIGIGRRELLATGLAEHQGGVAAPVQEEQGLLPRRERLGHGYGQGG